MSASHDAQKRELCDVCARYDWKSHLTRCLGSHHFAPAFCCEWGEIPHHQKNSVRKPPSEASHRWLTESRALFQLSPLESMIRTQKFCSLCRLIVNAVDVLVARERLKYFLGHEGPVECIVTDPEFAPDHAVLSVTIEADIGDESESMEFFLSFLLVEEDSEVCIQSSTSSHVYISLGRRMINPEQVELDIVRTWWNNCAKAHRSCVNDLEQRDLAEIFMFRVIDLSTDRVIVPPQGTKYIALSYVWGHTNSYHASWRDFVEPDLTSSVAMQVSAQAYLPLRGADLPKTIRDVMTVVQAIGERYLWVDALCIIQDNQKEKLTTIAAMDRIYKSASLTIFAAGSPHADSGLPGVRKGSRTIPSVCGALEGMNLIIAEEPYDLQESPWSRRGWTYQEEAFSKRCIIFANDRVYYECAEGAWGEARAGSKLPRGMKMGRQEAHETAFKVYAQHVSLYARRDLKYETDILYAFAGILRDYETSHDTTSCWGLPLDIFDRALLWRNRSKTQGLTRRATRQSPDSPPFPSWSWSGWVGSVHYIETIYNDGGIPADHTLLSQVIWPWDPLYSISAGERVFKEGIFWIWAEFAILDHSELEQDEAYCSKYEQGRFDERYPESVRKNAYFRFDDGSYWRSGSKECFLLSCRGSPTNAHPLHDNQIICMVMIVRRQEDGLCYREGWLKLSKNVWEAARPLRKLIRLG